jgi:hypothetical protein
MMHTAVGLQHGSMAIYNAWADRVPIFMITANQADVAKRRSSPRRTHAGVCPGSAERPTGCGHHRVLALDQARQIGQGYSDPQPAIGKR